VGLANDSDFGYGKLETMMNGFLKNVSLRHVENFLLGRRNKSVVLRNAIRFGEMKQRDRKGWKRKMGLSPNNTESDTFTLGELRKFREQEAQRIRRSCKCVDCKCDPCECDDDFEASMVERQFKAAKDEGLVVE
jgi:hypothetical protein